MWVPQRRNLHESIFDKWIIQTQISSGKRILCESHEKKHKIVTKYFNRRNDREEGIQLIFRDTKFYHRKKLILETGIPNDRGSRGASGRDMKNNGSSRKKPKKRNRQRETEPRTNNDSGVQNTDTVHQKVAIDEPTIEVPMSKQTNSVDQNLR